MGYLRSFIRSVERLLRLAMHAPFVARLSESVEAIRENVEKNARRSETHSEGSRP